MSDKFWSVCPVVHRGPMRLWQQANVGGEWRLIPFEREVLWLRQSEAEIVLRHGGREVDTRATLNDFYGFLTSLEWAVTDDVPGLADHYGVTADTLLSVDVDVTVSDVPCLADTSAEGAETFQRTGRATYVSVPDEGGKRWYLSDKPAEGEDALPALKSQVVAERKPVYTTRGKTALGQIPADLAAWIAEQRNAAAGKGDARA